MNGMGPMLTGLVLLTKLAFAANTTTDADLTFSAHDASSRVIHLGESALLYVEVHNRRADQFEGRLALEILDFDGVPSESGSKPLSLGPDDRQLLTFRFPFERVGYFRVSAILREGAEDIASDDTLWSFAVLEPGDDFPSDSPFGTYTIGNTMLLADIVPNGFYRDMATMGARWGTIDVWWTMLEGEEGVYEWDYYDPWFDAALSEGITPIPHLFGIPRWISSNPDADNYWAYPPKDWARWEQFVTDFVEHNREWLVYLRIWNEANVGYWQGTPEEYGKLVIHASEAAKRVKPELKIIIDTVADKAQDVFPFLNSVDAAGATSHWDVNGLHNYWLNNTDYPERTPFLKTYKEFIDWTKARNPDAEVWDTEFACMVDDWGTWWEGVGEKKQAQWLARAHVLGFSLGLDKMFWFPGYSWPDPDTAPHYNPAGLVRVDLSPRPAYLAYHTVAVALSRAAFVDSIDLGTDRFCKVFKSPAGYVTAAWTTDAAHAGSVELLFQGSDNITLMSLMGQKTPIADSGSAHQYTLKINENVVFIFSSNAPSLTPTSEGEKKECAGDL